MTVKPTEGKEEEEMNYQMHFDPYPMERLRCRGFHCRGAWRLSRSAQA
jgi:hypothetical protein